MRRRHVPNSFTGSPNGSSNHTPTDQPYFPTGRPIAPENGPGPFIGEMNHMTNEYHSSNVGTEIQPYVPVPPVEPYPPHSSVTQITSLPQVAHAHPTNYNIPSMRDVGPLKRKRSGSFYSAGSSSSSSQIPPYRGGPLAIGGEEDSDSSRNVRRRYRLDLGETRPHVPTNYHSAPGQHHNHYAPQYNPSRADSRNEMNQFHIGGSSAAFFSRHHHAREEHHSRRAEPSFGNVSRYSHSHYAHGATSSSNGPHTPHANFSSRYSRHYSHGGWRSSYRPRLAVDRIEHQSVMVADRPPFYGTSGSFSDQYRDFRLDIDNMSYEELLNLEERIGNVSTGLSEDSIFKFLREKVYCSSDQNLKEVSCPICLEEYINGYKIGTMEKCGHDYHVDCIKKWLLMKKLCPICKTECSD